MTRRLYVYSYMAAVLFTLTKVLIPMPLCIAQGNRDAVEKSALQAMAQGDLQKAEKILLQSIQVWPNDVGLHLRLAQAFKYQGKYVETIVGYTNVINLDRKKKHPKAYLHRAEANYAIGNYAAAIKDASACEKLIPRYTKVYSVRGRSYAKIGMINEAMKDFATLLKISPGSKSSIESFLADLEKNP